MPLSKCLNLRPWEAAAMAAGRVREIWRPIPDLKPTGDNGGEIREIVPSRLAAGFWDVRYELDNPRVVISPYWAGVVLACREAWRDWTPFGCERVDELIEFKASPWNFTPAWPHPEDKEPKWRSAQQMPANLARFRPVVASCEPRRVGSITGAEDFQTGVKVCEENGHDDCFYGTQGYRCAFLRQWQDAYPGAAWAWRVVLEGAK